MQPTSVEADWRPSRRIAFRFAFVYLLLFNLSYSLQSIDLLETVLRPVNAFWNAVVPWVGHNVLQLDHEISTVSNGSGDRTYDYVQLLGFLAVSVAAAAIWSALDRRGAALPRLHQCLRLYVRVSLGMAMIAYGSIKVIQAQFPAPSLDRLFQPFGDASPMGLLWAFMGTSTAYNVFVGAGEMLGGLLLFTRRTTPLGALVCTAVAGHIVALNFCFDVPVKIFSTHLLAMAVFLVLPDARRLANVLLLNRPAEPAELQPLFRRRWLERGALVLRPLFVAAVLALCLHAAHESRQWRVGPESRSPLHGIWEVEEFALDGVSHPPLVTDPVRWRRIVIDYHWLLAVQSMDGSRQLYGLQLDTEKRTLSLRKREAPSWKLVLQYERPEPDRLLLRGELDGQQLEAALRRVEPPPFRLTSRGFHWINEFPFNR